MTFDEAVEIIREKAAQDVVDDEYKEALRHLVLAWDQGKVDRINSIVRDKHLIPEGDIYIMFDALGPTYRVLTRIAVEQGVVNHGW